MKPNNVNDHNVSLLIVTYAATNFSSLFKLIDNLTALTLFLMLKKRSIDSDIGVLILIYNIFIPLIDLSNLFVFEIDPCHLYNCIRLRFACTAN